MPTPHKSEKQDEFVSRCVSDDEMVKKHTDQKERLAVCYSLYKQHQKKSTSEWISKLLEKNHE